MVYFLIPFLPPVQLGVRPEMGLEELEALLNRASIPEFEMLKNGSTCVPESPFLKAYFEEEARIKTAFIALRSGKTAGEEFAKIYEKSPLEMEKALIEYKFKKIDEWIGLNLFSEEAVLAYMAKVYLNEEILKWDSTMGKKLLDRLEAV